MPESQERHQQNHLDILNEVQTHIRMTYLLSGLNTSLKRPDVLYVASTCVNNGVTELHAYVFVKRNKNGTR